jgi:hypothetical protein
MEGVAMDNKDWIILAADAAAPGPLSPVQLQKTLFILKQELPGEVGAGFYQFRPYNYGPFSSPIYSDAEVLAKQGLITIDTVPGQSWPNYSITAAGRAYAQELVLRASGPAVPYLRSLVDWATKIRFQDLLRSVYAKYPEYAVNSVFRG